MAKKGSKNAPGVPAIWEEVKGKVTMTLTPRATTGLDALAKELRLSRSELVERVGRVDLGVLAENFGISRQALLEEIKNRLPPPPQSEG